ncbi:MAG TPA: ABC transporter ATP-binding protein, partial [Clostridia bacterium]|nr:ABC transporter ATP-binding protein [Clostridia bacterium]
LVWRIKPVYFITLFLNSLIYSAHVLTNVIFPRNLINELIGAKDSSVLVIWILVIVLSNVTFTFLKKTLKRLLDVQEKDLFWQIERAFSDKIMSIEYRYLEDPYYLDLKERATFAMRNQSSLSRLINMAITFINQSVTVVGLVVLILNLSWILVISLIFTVFILIFIQARFSKYQLKFFSELIPVNRRYGYYVNLTFDKTIHKDSRLFNMTGMFTDIIVKYNIEINKWFSKFYRKIGLYIGLFQVVVVLQTILAYGFVGAWTLGGQISIGDLTMYVSAAVGFSSAVITLGESIISILQVLGYLEPFMELMEIPVLAQSEGKEKINVIESIEFSKVSFKYPKTDKLILDDISFIIEKGQKISIVGLNGAGKSTIVKLLCRLYKPDEGRILVNGKDIYDYSYEDYMLCISAVFQDYKLFNFSIYENISCNDIGSDDEKVSDILEMVDMKKKVESLPNGVKSLFGKEYDEEGVEFSIGQSQKIAIARALYKDSSLVILDEPTSALDPIAEAEIYENFNNLVGDKTAIYISHRMSSSIFCDRILVINEGRIEDFDSHQKLMKKKNSLYYKLFNSQAENYRYEKVMKTYSSLDNGF